MEEGERTALASVAQKSGESRGRQHSEPSHAYRTEFQRDRARIIHSRAFRRLEYKTQVFLNGTGDHLRTRLTHSIEVASISRTIARALRLNEDLAEAIALAHDLGHSPFGHSGEEMLAECMRDHGGFDHNRQSVRVVELLETPYPNFPGLNLTFEVREGLRKHERPYKFPTPAGEEYDCPSLEGQVADLADEITYYSHDLDDALDFEILTPARLEENEVWRNSHRAVLARYTDAREPELHKLIIRDIIDREVHDLVATSAESIAESGVQSADDVRRQTAPLIRYSDELAEANRRAPEIFVSKCLLPSARRGSEPTRLRDAAARFRSVPCRSRQTGRGRDATSRKGGIASHSLRLHRGNDRPLCNGRICADCR